MITSKLKTALTTAGCNLVLYESDKIAGIITDQSNKDSILGLIIQPNYVDLEAKGNGIHVHYTQIIVEIMSQVKPEDTAENNAATWEVILGICLKFLYALEKSGSFKKITTTKLSAILESKYDANLIGWALPLDLFYLENRENC